MELQIIGKNGVKVSDGAKEYIQKKMTKFIRNLPDMDEAKIEVLPDKIKSRQDSFIVQATINHKGTFLRAEEKGSTIHAAADAVAEVLERQLERYKGRLQKKRKGSPTVRQSAAPREEEVAPYEPMPSPRVSKVKQFIINRVTVEEAIDQMELLNHDFFLFVNNRSNVLSLVYRRKSGDYGLIEPEVAQ